MKKRSLTTLKIFLLFLLMAAISIVLFKFMVFDEKAEFEEALNISQTFMRDRIGALDEGLNSINNNANLLVGDKSVPSFIKNISKAYNKIATKFSDDVVSDLQEELKVIYTRLYGAKSAESLTPSDKTAIIAQAAAMRGDLGDRELFNALVQDENVKKYIVEETKLIESLHKEAFENGIEDFVLADKKGRIVFAYANKAVLGDDIFKGNPDGLGAIEVTAFKNHPRFGAFQMGFADSPSPAVYLMQTFRNTGSAVAVAGSAKLGEFIYYKSAPKEPSDRKFSLYMTDVKGKLIASDVATGKAVPSFNEFKFSSALETGSLYDCFRNDTSAGAYAVCYSQVTKGENAAPLAVIAAATPYESGIFLTLRSYLSLIIGLALFSWIIAMLISRYMKKTGDSFRLGAVENYQEQAAVSKEEPKNLSDSSLREEHDFMDSILNSSGISLIVLDENEKIMKVNASLLKIFDEKYIIGKDIFVALPEKYRDEVTRACLKVRTTGENILVHTITERPDQDVHLEWTLSRIQGSDPSKVYISAIGLNVTEKYLAKEKLNEREEILQIIMSHAQDAIIVSNNENNITIANEAAGKMLGHSSGDLRGKPMVPTVIPEEYREEFMDDVSDGIMLEIYAVNKNGDRFPIELSVSKVKVMGKVNTLYIIRDASIRKKRENEMFKTLEKAKSAEKAKSEFLANMSHEIRTPLNGIIGFLSLLKQTPLNKTQLEYMNIIDSSSDSLLNIINDILDFSKIESGKMILESTEFNATEAFEQVTELYAAKASEKSINLIVIVDPKMPEWLVGDQLRLKQILSNLLSNALKFTEPGGCVTISVILESREGNQCVLRISVKDTGIGISKENQAIIFDAFSQADSSVTRKYGGSGLGLTICVRIARLMGGSGLHLQSEEGKGSEFFFNATFEIGVNESREKPVFKGVVVALHDCSDNTCLFRNACKGYLEILQCDVKAFETFEELKALGNVDIILMGYRGADKELLKSIQEFAPDKPTIYLACDWEAGSIRHLESNTVRTLSQPLNMSKFLDAFTFLMRKNTTVTHEATSNKQSEAKFTGHVLVVEDNAVNRRLADIILRKFGLTVELAINGKEALNMFLKNKFDIIFMDIHMPILDGVSATKEIIRIEKESGAAHTPIVALTANVIKEDRDSYLEAGMDGFLAKPIEQSKLETVLVDYLTSDKAKVLLQKLSAIFEIEDLDATRNIVSEFLKVASNQIIEMREALNSKDLARLGSVANSMKGAAMNLRFDSIVLSATHIEENIAADKDTDYGNIVDDLETELMRIKRIIG